MLDHYKQKGWVHLKDELPQSIIQIIKSESMRLRMDWQKYSDWKGIPMADKYSKDLYCAYRQRTLRDIACELLETDMPYLFNNEVVVKLGNDDLDFHVHTDNEYGGNRDNRIHTVNCMVVTDDFTEDNGPLIVINKDNGRHVTLLPKSGDVVAVNGSTLHYSGKNTTDYSRGQFSCVYSAEPMPLPNFYRNKFDEVYDGC